MSQQQRSQEAASQRRSGPVGWPGAAQPVTPTPPAKQSPEPTTVGQGTSAEPEEVLDARSHAVSEGNTTPDSTASARPDINPAPSSDVPAAATEGGQRQKRPVWKKLASGGPRTLMGTLLASVLALGLGFAVVTQVRQNEKSGLSDLGQADLVALLSNVNDQSARLNQELDELRATRDELSRGGDQAAVADAQKRLDQLAILNGTTKVKGQGITITVDNSSGGVTSANVLDAVQELRDAGAEAIDVGGNRVIASTWFADRDGKVTVDGTPLPGRFKIMAIGDSHTMGTAMAIPGGVTDTLTQAGAEAKVAEEASLQITSVHPAQ